MNSSDNVSRGGESWLSQTPFQTSDSRHKFDLTLVFVIGSHPG